MNSDSIKILEDLIKFPTFQDPEKPDKVPDGMKECAEFLRNRLEKLSFDVKVDELCNVTGVREFDGEGDFVINAHTDTIVPDPEWGDALKPKIVGNKLFGQGASDDKASIAGVLSSLYNLKDCRFRRLFIQFVNYEDNVFVLNGRKWNGVEYLLAKNPGFKADYGLNLEPTVDGDRFTISVNCTGRVKYTVKTIGKEAHSSTPHLGRNAIYDMRRVLEVIENLPPGKYSLGDEEVEMPFTASTINGGRGLTIIPGECTVVGERRILPGEDPEEKKQVLKSALDQLREKGIQIELEFGPKVAPAYAIDVTEPVVELVNGAFLHTLDYRPKVKIKTGRTDSMYLYHMAGIKTAIFGPGQLGVYHKRDEYVIIERVRESTNVMKALLSKSYGK